VQSRASCPNIINSQGPNQILLNFLQIQHLERSMIFNSNSIPNFEMFQSRKLFLIYFPSNPCFIWNFLSKGRPFFDRIDLIPFEKFLNKSTRILFLWAGPKATGPRAIFLPAYHPLRTSPVTPPDSHRLRHVYALPVPGPLHWQSRYTDPPPLPRCPLRVVHRSGPLFSPTFLLCFSSKLPNAPH
jgi:hypothetical protein